MLSLSLSLSLSHVQAACANPRLLQMPAPTSGGNHRPSRAAAPGILASRTAAPPPQSARRGSSSTHSGSQSLTRGARRTPHPHGTRRTASCQCGGGVVMVWWQCGVGGRGRGGAVAHKPEEQSSPPLPPSPPLCRRRLRGCRRCAVPLLCRSRPHTAATALTAAAAAAPH